MHGASLQLSVGIIALTVCLADEASGSITAKSYKASKISGVEVIDYSGDATLKLNKSNTEQAVYAHAAKIRYNPKQKSFLVFSPAVIYMNRFVFQQSQPGTSLLISEKGEPMNGGGAGKWLTTLSMSLPKF